MASPPSFTCQRCFDLKNYQKSGSKLQSYESVVKLLFSKIKSNNYVLYLVGIYKI